MEWSNSLKIRLMLVGFVAGIVLGVGSAKADFTFGEPTNLGSTVNSISNDQAPSISADGLELYFSEHQGAPYRPGGQGLSDLWITTRQTKDDPWGVPVNLGPVVNSSAKDEHPSISADGLSLYFGSNRSGGKGDHDLWVTTRATKDAPWSEPVNLGSPVNSSYSEWGPNISADGLSLYFSDYLRSRPGNHGEWDTHVTTRETVSDPWSTPVNLGQTVNSSGIDASPNISADGLMLFLNSDRSGGSGGSDIWMARRKTPDADWEHAINPGPTVNASGFDAMPNVSYDGYTLYFCSERPGGSGNVDLWQVSIEPVLDFNGDGIVDIDDLVIMIERWGTDETLCDIGPMPWGDGVVDEVDLEVLMSYWGQDVADPTLIAHWKLDETEGTMANDSAGEIQADLFGDPVWRPTDGMVDGALMLDGIDDFVGTWNIPDLLAGRLSVFAWVKGGAPGQVVVSQFRGVNWLMADASQGYLKTDLKEAGDTAQSLVSEVTITDGNWHRVGITWDGTNRVLYVDDVAVASDAQTSLERSDMGLNIGCGPDETSGTFFSGLIDDVRIYNRAVTP